MTAMLVDVVVLLVVIVVYVGRQKKTWGWRSLTIELPQPLRHLDFSWPVSLPPLSVLPVAVV